MEVAVVRLDQVRVGELEAAMLLLRIYFAVRISHKPPHR